MNEQTTTIEVNGVKLEVDLRNAKRIDTFKVGTKVKVLKKEYSGHKVMHGVVIGFEPFKSLPTIIVAVAKVEYQLAKIEFIYFNADSKDVELVVANNDDSASIDKNNFIAEVDRSIRKKQEEIKELNQRKQYFLDKFECYWNEVDLENDRNKVPRYNTD